MEVMKYMLGQKSDFKLVLDDDFEKVEEAKPQDSCGNIARFHIKAPLQEALSYPIVKLLMADSKRDGEIYSLVPVSDSECVLDVSQINRSLKVERAAGVVSYHKFVDYKTKGRKK
ncbi:hypothetical protein AO287_26395 [Pseudomonas savastanoi]|uniref:Uncharacterized protein n=2 Tax=Pseudomonas savastanoi TaxID=29438 RepID=A0AAW3M8R8_PSESS|nr:hypothetical protein AO287_26395 [Pseudomonas savastanoi]